MKRVNIGEVNDGKMYAVIGGYDENNEPMLYPLDDDDLEFQAPDVEIGFDTGVYPGRTLEELPYSFCRKAARLL